MLSPLGLSATAGAAEHVDMPPIGALEIARYHLSLYIQGAAAGGADPGNRGRGRPTMDAAEYMHDSIGLTREQARFDPFAGAEGRGAKRAVPFARRGGFMAQGSAGAGARWTSLPNTTKAAARRHAETRAANSTAIDATIQTSGLH